MSITKSSKRKEKKGFWERFKIKPAEGDDEGRRVTVYRIVVIVLCIVVPIPVALAMGFQEAVQVIYLVASVAVLVAVYVFGVGSWWGDLAGKELKGNYVGWVGLVAKELAKDVVEKERQRREQEAANPPALVEGGEPVAPVVEPAPAGTAQPEPEKREAATSEPVMPTPIPDRVVVQMPLEEAGDPKLDEVARQMAASPGLTASITGHTDDRGSDAANLKLGLRHAQSAKDLIVKGGIAEDRITVQSEGESSPITGNDSSEGRRTNRRVEIEFGSTASAEGG